MTPPFGLPLSIGWRHRSAGSSCPPDREPAGGERLRMGGLPHPEQDSQGSRSIETADPHVYWHSLSNADRRSPSPSLRIGCETTFELGLPQRICVHLGPDVLLRLCSLPTGPRSSTEVVATRACSFVSSKLKRVPRILIDNQYGCGPLLRILASDAQLTPATWRTVRFISRGLVFCLCYIL